MNQPTRLFDCLELHVKNAPRQIMLAGKEEGAWKTYTTAQVSEIVNNLSAGLLALGINSGDSSAEGRDKIAVIS
ncbi:MAG: long-chain fatty acid--CoA ligase, partial [Bacteroidota bacterium]|nr:long-chain fatty acid--CoA ligase [Bacteroidota bacterium]